MLSLTGKRPHFSPVSGSLWTQPIHLEESIYPKTGALWIEVPGDQQQPLEAEK